MTKLRVVVIIGSFPVAIACSGSSPGTAANRSTGSASSGTPASGSSGSQSASGSSGSGGGVTGGDGGGACVLPSCLENLAPTCVGTGTCATMTNLETDDYNTCFPNGVVESAVIDPTSGNTTLTVKQSSTTCFSTTFNYNQAWSGTGSITVVDASGKTVATARMDATDNLRNLVMCSGAQEVALDFSCASVWPISALTGSKCDEGGCSP
jgi:hypothetical protein